MNKIAEFVSGSCERFLFSTKGEVEGVMIKTERGVVQVAMRPSDGTMLASTSEPGKKMRFLAIPDHSHKASSSDHRVYTFESLADAEEQALEKKDLKDFVIEGTVKFLHFSRHGEPNGVVLETGEFIHLRPHNMAGTAFKAGAKVDAVGKLRMTALGTRLLEARHLNRVDLL